MKRYLVTLITCLIFSITGISLALEKSAAFLIKEKLKESISNELKEIQQAMKEVESSAMHMTPKEWRQIFEQQQKQLNNLLSLVVSTPEEKLPAVVTSLFIDEQKYVNKYPRLEPYILIVGELIIPPFVEKFDQVDPRVKERILDVLGRIHSRESLPLVRKALQDKNQRVNLFAQRALRLILGLEAKPELEKMLVATKSSWSLQYTLREISFLGDKGWYESFFKLARSKKMSLSDLTMIGFPKDCPEDVIGVNLDFLMKIISLQDEQEIHASDFYSLSEFFLYLKGEKKSVFIDDILSNFNLESLENLKSVADATELTGEHEDLIVAAFNKTKDNLRLYPENATQIEFKNSALKDKFEELISRGIFMKTYSNNWRVKDQLTPEELDSIKWFNIDLLNQEFPSILSKVKNNKGEQSIARALLLKLDQRKYLKQLVPLIPTILRDRYRYGGKIEGFSQIAPVSDSSLGFFDSEADILLQKISANLNVEDIKEWLNQDAQDLLTRFFLEDLVAQKGGGNIVLNKREFLFKIEAFDEANNLLASKLYPLEYNVEQDIILPAMNKNFPDHHIKLKVQLDRDKWFFHLDPVLIDLKPYGAGFDIYIPIAGVYEIFLTETFAGQKEKVLWRFEHIDKINMIPTPH